MLMKINIKQSRPYTFFMAQKLSLKILIVAGLFFLLADVTLVIVHFTSVKYSSARPHVEGEEAGDALLALNSQAIHSNFQNQAIFFINLLTSRKSV